MKATTSYIESTESHTVDAADLAATVKSHKEATTAHVAPEVDPIEAETFHIAP